MWGVFVQGLVHNDASIEPEQYNEKCGVIGVFNVEQVCVLVTVVQRCYSPAADARSNHA
jgi:hypothetical protein